MGILSKVKIGVLYEFRVYRYHPKQLLKENYLILLCFLVTVCLIVPRLLKAPHAYYDFDPGYQIVVALVLACNYFTPAFKIISKIHGEKQNRFRRFLIVNGMPHAAYQAQIIITTCILSLFTALIGILELYLIIEYLYSPDFFKDGIALSIVYSFLLNYCSGLAIICFCLSCTTLSIKGRVKSILTCLFIGTNVAIISGCMILLINEKVESISMIILEGLCLLSPIAEITLNFYILYENSGNDSYISGPVSAFEQCLGLGFLILSTILYLFIYIMVQKGTQQRKSINKLHRSALNTNLIPSTDQKPHHLSHRFGIMSEDRYLSSSNSVDAIRLIELKKMYGQSTVLDCVTFSVRQGEIFCLVGQNGAGKTTLLNILAGLESLTHGSFFYNNQEMNGNLDELYKLIGFCAQDDFILENSTVYENLCYFAELKHLTERTIDLEIDSVMTKLKLLPFMYMPASKLSGGMKRRLNIAIALLNNPGILIMDEPTAGLDPVARREFWEILRELRDQKKTILLTTQFYDEVEELADRVAVLSKGRLFAIGGLDFIKKQFQVGYTLSIESKSTSFLNTLFYHVSRVGSVNLSREEALCLRIDSKVKSIIPSAEQVYIGAFNVLKYILPSKEQKTLADLLASLEEVADIRTHIQFISLEEGFASVDFEAKAIDIRGEVQRVPICQFEIPKSFLFRMIDTNWRTSVTFTAQLGARFLQRCYWIRSNKTEAFSTIFIAFGLAALYVVVLVFVLESILASILARSYIQEREVQIIHISNVMGLKSTVYWLASLSMDLILSTIIFMVPFVVNAGLIMYDPENFSSSIMEILLRDTFILYIPFTINQLLLTYNLSMNFGFRSCFFINLLIWAAGILFVPVLSFKSAIMGVLLQSYDSLLNPCHSDNFKILILLWWPIYFGLLISRSALLYESAQKRLRQDRADHTPLHKDVAALQQEQTRVVNSSTSDAVQAVGVKKTYSNGLKALDSLTFGAKKNQTFCLLGPNSAGKSTAFGVLTSQIKRTEGGIYLNGRPMSRYFSFASKFEQAGICMQTNTLWDSLTVEQHLKVYAKLKGLSKQDSQDIISFLLRSLYMDGDTHKQAQQLSGGTKRKLCVAIALIATPELVFLDEATTAMDPMARRQVWNLLKAVMKATQGTTIMTTHYMEEAELVADKIGILVLGSLVTIGSMSDLRQSHGEYTISIQRTEDGLSKQELNEVLTTILMDVVMNKDTSITNSNQKKIVTFRVPINSMKLSKVFRELEEKKSSQQIEDFWISQTTLDEIFVKMAQTVAPPSILDDLQL